MIASVGGLAGARDGLVGELRAVVGDTHVLTDRALTASYETDWTGRFTGAAVAVVRPADTAQVAGVLACCARHGVPVVPQGGNTGLVAGGVPLDGGVVLSTRRLDRLGPVDATAGAVTVGAGAVLSQVAGHVRAAGFDVGVDLAARDSATIGGMVATNAGGERVLRYGSMRAQVLGMEAVLADGTVVSRLAGLPKDNTGYDLAGLLTGSEGTLGVITAVRLRLVPAPAYRAVALVAVDSTSDALGVLTGLRTRLPGLACAEVVYDEGLIAVCAHTGLPAPFPQPAPVVLLVEVTDPVADPTDTLVTALDAVADTGSVRDAVVGGDRATRERLWRYREAHTETVNALGVPVKLDVAVPVGALPGLVDRLPGVVEGAAPGARLVLFGHLAEGNLHVNVLGASEPARAHAVEDAVLRLVASMSGSISAEHGVGRAKVEWLGLSRSAAELAAMRAIKAALDPAGLLNPGVLLPVT